MPFRHGPLLVESFDRVALCSLTLILFALCPRTVLDTISSASAKAHALASAAAAPKADTARASTSHSRSASHALAWPLTHACAPSCSRPLIHGALSIHSWHIHLLCGHRSEDPSSGNGFAAIFMSIYSYVALQIFLGKTNLQ